MQVVSGVVLAFLFNEVFPRTAANRPRVGLLQTSTGALAVPPREAVPVSDHSHGWGCLSRPTAQKLMLTDPFHSKVLAFRSKLRFQLCCG